MAYSLEDANSLGVGVLDLGQQKETIGQTNLDASYDKEAVKGVVILVTEKNNKGIHSSFVIVQIKVNFCISRQGGSRGNV